MSFFKLLRIVALLSVLFVIVVSTWMVEKRMAAWERPILVTVYPIAADGDPASIRFAEELSEDSFRSVNRFFERESGPYDFTVTPAFRFQVAAPSAELPPAVPEQYDFIRIALWSLRMRWWAWMQDLGDELIQPDIQMFMLYYSLNGVVEPGISVGMRKGRYTIVKAYARESQRERNLVVFTHEMLHVLGATDKYVLSTGEPIFPHGYANPNQEPLFPQQQAEIMGVRIPLTSYSSRMVGSVASCKIGRDSAVGVGGLGSLGGF